MFIRGKNDITIDYSISLHWELPVQLQFYTEGVRHLSSIYSFNEHIDLGVNNWKLGTVKLDVDQYQKLENYILTNHTNIYYIEKLYKDFFSLSKGIKEQISVPFKLGRSYDNFFKLMAYTSFNWIFKDLELKDQLIEISEKNSDLFSIASQPTIVPHYIYKEFRILSFCHDYINKRVTDKNYQDFLWNVVPLLDFNITTNMDGKDQVNKFIDKYIEQNNLTLKVVNKLREKMKENILIKREEKFKAFQKISVEKSNLKAIYLLVELINTEEEIRHYLQMYFQHQIYRECKKNLIDISKLKVEGGKIIVV
jgi:hypothetical protein